MWNSCSLIVACLALMACAPPVSGEGPIEDEATIVVETGLPATLTLSDALTLTVSAPRAARLGAELARLGAHVDDTVGGGVTATPVATTDVSFVLGDLAITEVTFLAGHALIQHSADPHPFFAAETRFVVATPGDGAVSLRFAEPSEPPPTFVGP